MQGNAVRVIPGWPLTRPMRHRRGARDFERPPSLLAGAQGRKVTCPDLMKGAPGDTCAPFVFLNLAVS